MWEDVFEPACAIFGLKPVRSDRISEPGEIPEQIFTYLRDADVVIADLTGGNANVMYELGLRHTRNKITVQIGEYERLPFDVNTIRTIQFRRTEAGLIDARNTLIETLRVALKGDARPVTATRVWRELDILDPDTVAKQSALSYVTDDPADFDDTEEDGLGRLDRLAEGEDAMQRLSDVLATFTSHMQDFGAIASEFAPRAEGAGSFNARLTVLRQYLDALHPIATNMDTTADEYLGAVETVDGAMSIFIQEFEDNPQMLHEDEMADFLASVMGFCRVTESTNVNVTTQLHMVREMRAWSKIVRPVSKTLQHAFNTTLRANEIVTGWAERLRAIPGWVEPPLTDWELENAEDPDDNDYDERQKGD
jgi:hypothetical protein